MTGMYAAMMRVPVIRSMLSWLGAFAHLARDRAAVSVILENTERRIARLEGEVQRLSEGLAVWGDTRTDAIELRNLAESAPVTLRTLRRDLDALARRVP
jgi:hypothetical protein